MLGSGRATLAFLFALNFPPFLSIFFKNFFPEFFLVFRFFFSAWFLLPVDFPRPIVLVVSTVSTDAGVYLLCVYGCLLVRFGQQKVAKLKLVNWAVPRVLSVMRWPINGEMDPKEKCANWRSYGWKLKNGPAAGHISIFTFFTMC